MTIDPDRIQNLPVLKSMADLEKEYMDYAKQSDALGLDLGTWLPSFRKHGVRPLVPGELCFIMGDTGTGKTAAIQNIMASHRSENAILFEMELPGTLLFERQVANALGMTGTEVEAAARTGAGFALYDLLHIFVCDQGRVSMPVMKALIQGSTAINPRFVYVDYIGLMGGPGKSRHERVAQCAEDLKVLARETETVIVAATQMHRTEDDDYEPDLHSAKNAGEIENSCGLLLGIHRDPDDATLLWVKVLKNTKGRAGAAIACNFDGARTRITERAAISAVEITTETELVYGVRQE